MITMRKKKCKMLEIIGNTIVYWLEGGGAYEHKKITKLFGR